jgi:hypothetical protein
MVANTFWNTLSAYDDIKEPELGTETKENIELYKQQLHNE